MDKKKSLQVSLILLLLLSTIFFYQKYFNVKTDIANKDTSDKKIETESLNSSDEKKETNIIESLRYTSQDLIGNTYIISAESAKFEKNETDNIILFNVDAEIIRQDSEVIKIYSATANYNRKNNDTEFKEDVRIEYSDQIIKSGVVKLNFSKNLIEIIENVYYMNDNTKIYADKVELDYLRKKMKISMIDQNKDIQILGKY